METLKDFFVILLVFFILVMIGRFTLSESKEPAINENATNTITETITKPNYIGRLLHAIRIKESSDGINLVGDGGDSLGAYQLQKEYVKDACEYGRANWKYEDVVYDEIKSQQIIVWYWLRYNSKALYRFNENGDCESLDILARIHNGGPRGHKKKATVKYGQDVKFIYERCQ